MQKPFTRRKIINHYKQFFGLQDMGLAEGDHLTIDWAESLIEACEGKESPDESGNRMKPDVSGSLLTSESCLEVANRMLSAFKSADVKTFPTMVIRAETMQDYINAIRKQ